MILPCCIHEARGSKETSAGSHQGLIAQAIQGAVVEGSPAEHMGKQGFHTQKLYKLSLHDLKNKI